jgi:peptide chain release factor 2
VRELEAGIRDNSELIELGAAEGDDAIVKEAEQALLALRDTASRYQIETLLSGEADSNDAYLEIHSGAGGTAEFQGRDHGNPRRRRGGHQVRDRQDFRA